MGGAEPDLPEIGKLPLESCDTINKAWGYNSKDKQYKSVTDLIHFLARAAGHNSNTVGLPNHVIW